MIQLGKETDKHFQVTEEKKLNEKRNEGERKH